jgi:hypothetical protein
LAPRQFPAGLTYGDVVAQLVGEVYPTATIEWDDATDAVFLTRSVLAEDDRYAFLNDLIRAAGKIWYWDHRGILVIRSVPDPTTSVWDVTHGRDGVLVSMSRSLSRDGVYNAVVASGEGGDTETPVRAAVVDANPASPTYYYGRFGPVPKFYSSPFIATVVQAAAAASNELRQNLGLPYNVSFGSVANAALEPYDAVLVRYSDRNAAETHVLRSLTIPLGTAAMTAQTREQSIVLLASL